MLKVKMILGEYQNKLLVAQPITFFNIWYVREIKNRNKNFFFYRKKISHWQHLKWYCKYVFNRNDVLYVLKMGQSKYGTIGIRKINLDYELYSVIQDKNLVYYPNLMQKMVKVLLNSYIVNGDIYSKVISPNGALDWYLKLGFIVESSSDKMVQLKLRKEVIES